MSDAEDIPFRKGTFWSVPNGCICPVPDVLEGPLWQYDCPVHGDPEPEPVAYEITGVSIKGEPAYAFESSEDLSIDLRPSSHLRFALDEDAVRAGLEAAFPWLSIDDLAVRRAKEAIDACLNGEEVPEVRRTPEEWGEHLGIRIHDPDGWRGEDAPFWETPITRDEYLRRAELSTVEHLGVYGTWPPGETS